MNLLKKLDKLVIEREESLEQIAKDLGRDLSTLNDFDLQEDVYKARMDNLDSEIEYFSK